jgi:hypothetical protein
MSETQGTLFNAGYKGLHHCHWPGCKVPVAPKLWGCRPHWMRLPRPLRMRIVRHYRTGQEITKDPSEEYWEAAMDVQRWIRDHGGLV